MTQPFLPRRSKLAGEDGIAMLTVLMLTVILTVIGIAAVTTTTMDIWLAGGERTRETSVNVAEACLSSGVQIIQQTLLNAAIPGVLLTAGNNPSISPAPNPLQAEIMGTNNQNADTADPSLASVSGSGYAPNAVLTMPGGYIAFMDIDRLYVQYKVGSAIQFASGYEGLGAGAASGGVEILYRIECYAANAPTGGNQVYQVNTRISAVYSCVVSGESCQRKI
jgi:Tfp pilus assembly protein PilX